MENLQYHVHWIARCPRSRLFQNSQWRKEHLCKIWVRLCSLIFYHLTIIIQLCMWMCVISETWMRNKLYCCFLHSLRSMYLAINFSKVQNQGKNGTYQLYYWKRNSQVDARFLALSDGYLYVLWSNLFFITTAAVIMFGIYGN